MLHNTTDPYKMKGFYYTIVVLNLCWAKGGNTDWSLHMWRVTSVCLLSIAFGLVRAEMTPSPTRATVKPMDG